MTEIRSKRNTLKFLELKIVQFIFTDIVLYEQWLLIKYLCVPFYLQEFHMFFGRKDEANVTACSHAINIKILTNLLHMTLS